jgi:hypothetical protein
MFQSETLFIAQLFAMCFLRNESQRWVQPSLAGIQCSEPEPQRRPLPAHPGRLLRSGEPQQPRQPEIKLPEPINLANDSLSREGYLFEGLKKTKAILSLLQ